MKYKVSRIALFGLFVTHIVFFLCQYIIISVNVDALPEEINKAQAVFKLYASFLPVLLVQVISFIQVCGNFKTNRWVFGWNLTSTVICVAALFSTMWLEQWLEYGTFLSLGCVLLGEAVVPNQTGEDKAEDKHLDKKIPKIIATMLAVIMLIVAVGAFVEGSPSFVVSNGIIYIFVLVIVLLVWDSIESLSLGSVVTLTKAVKDKEKRVKELSEENRELRNQIISVVQNHQSANFNMSFNSGQATVEPTIKDDSEHQEIELDNTDTASVVETEWRERMPSSRRFVPRIQRSAISKFAVKNGINPSDLQRDVKFSEKFIASDQLIVRNIMIDAYLKRKFDEIFIEATMELQGSCTYDRIYYLLSKINQYRQNNRCDAKLIIVVPIVDRTAFQGVNERHYAYHDVTKILPRFKEKFAPAIENNLLEIAEIEITAEDIAEIEQEMRNQA